MRLGIAVPPSLRNVFIELRDDLSCRIPNNGYLVPWATQGVLLLNTVLTVRARAPNSHRSKGWERFTDAIIRSVNGKGNPVVFVLWGCAAQRKAESIMPMQHPDRAGGTPLATLSTKRLLQQPAVLCNQCSAACDGRAADRLADPGRMRTSHALVSSGVKVAYRQSVPICSRAEKFRPALLRVNVVTAPSGSDRR